MQPFLLSKRGIVDSVRPSQFPRKVQKAGLLICATAFCAAAALAGPPDDKQGSSSAMPAPTDARAMVEALANRNPVPVVPPLEGEPIFAKNYNWSECNRAAGAFDALIDHAEDAWQEMVAHLDDGRYSITYEAGSASREGYAYNWTVGDVCRAIIIASLTEGYLPHLDRLDKLSYRDLRDFVSDKKSLKAWCEARRTKKLYELQVDVCQWALAELKSGQFERVPKSRRTEWTTAVKSELNHLKTTKEPYRFKGFGESVALY